MSSTSVKRAAFYVEKGGVGKTTSTAHVGVSAHQDHGLDVLLIDLAGTQNDLSTQFGVADATHDPTAPISAVFGDNWEFIQENIPEIVDQMTFETGEGPDLIPADPGLTGADNNLTNIAIEERFAKLDAFIANKIAPRYDLVLLDLPGKEDNIALNGLFAAENIVTPLPPGAFERAQLDKLRTDLETIRDEHPVSPRLTMVIPTIVNQTTNLSELFVSEIETEFSEIVATPVTDTANIKNEQAAGQTLFAIGDDELYQTGKRARRAYRDLTTDLLSRVEAQ
ncbi:ParA family protein [Halococcus sp. PRR34]|uniref:ParA family protein n=1 Tax=Halococcus sp. PRR34 TaxID=3020830 RepID=UPI0023603749|nr:ParA family protein [Halococcus sp. PRR34]